MINAAARVALGKDSPHIRELVTLFAPRARTPRRRHDADEDMSKVRAEVVQVVLDAHQAEEAGEQIHFL